MNTTRHRTFFLLIAAALCGKVQGFIAPRSIVSKPNPALRSTTSEIAYEPVFDFSDSSKNAVSSFDRIDDAIMGGISTSAIRSVQTDDDESYASWSGVCRTDGGGFCGTRTLPFQDGKPLQVAKSADGFYLKLKLASDDEPERRIWKMTTRVENENRSEQLYQAEFEIPKSDNNSWQTIRVPFSKFRQARGPRLVENGPPLDVSGGLFQIGMTLSKFQMAATMKTLENFRAGYFEVQLSEIGVYTNDAAATSGVVETPKTLTKTEAQRKRPLALKILSPIFKRLFSEQRNRKKSATRILKERGWAVASFGFRRKVASRGILVAVAQSLLEGLVSVAGFVAFWILRLAVFYPLVAVRRTVKLLKANKTSNKSTPQTS